MDQFGRFCATVSLEKSVVLASVLDGKVVVIRCHHSIVLLKHWKKKAQKLIVVVTDQNEVVWNYRL